MSNNNQRKGLWQGLKEKGYYIALILCALAIGISGYLYYQSTKEKPNTTLTQQVTEPAAPRPNASKPALMDDSNAVPVIGTQPPETTDPTTTTPSKTDKPVKTMWPVDGEVATGYAMDQLAYNVTTRDWRTHNGIDLTAAAGTEVKAAADGTVYTVYQDEVLGTTVVIRHTGGYVTTYASLAEETAVQAGDAVTCGQVIGTVGQTALIERAVEPHVHFSVTWNDQRMDPAEFLAQ